VFGPRAMVATRIWVRRRLPSFLAAVIACVMYAWLWKILLSPSKAQTDKALDALIEHFGVIPRPADPEFGRCGPNYSARNCDCSGDAHWCLGSWCSPAKLHEYRDVWLYDCPERIRSKLEQLMAMPSHANLSKIALLKKVTAEDGDNSFQELETAEEIVAMSEKQRAEQSSKVMKNWHNMGKKLLGVVRGPLLHCVV
jgi:hypothetical protein